MPRFLVPLSITKEDLARVTSETSPRKRAKAVHEFVHECVDFAAFAVLAKMSDDEIEETEDVP